MTMREDIGINEYARHREALGLPGKSRAAVQKAIADGRLAAAIVYIHGRRPQIRDAELADREWAAATKSVHVPLTGGDGASALIVARTRRETALAGIAEIELGEMEGRFLKAAGVEERLVTVFSQCKGKLLGLPSRLKQRCPGVSLADLAALNSLIREALEELSVPPENPKGDRQ